VSKQQRSVRPTSSNRGQDAIIASVLRHLSLVDSPAEPGFNRFTRLVCQVADVRMALVTFVEEQANRQYFKAAMGLPAGTETSLDRSFCKIVARTGEMLSVTDARTDARVSDNPVIEEMGVRAYLGAPILGPRGEALGSLCAVDRTPRDWSDAHKRAIADLADCVSDHIALRHMRLA